jgi:replicative DNA helicase
MKRQMDQDVAMPDAPEVEKYILGAIMNEENAFLQVAGTLQPEDFSLEKHKRIFLRMMDVHDRGESIDRVTVANELIKHGQLQSIDGLSYLVSLDDGLPRIENLGAYVGIVKEKATLRKIIQISHDAEHQCREGASSSREILGTVEESLLRLAGLEQKSRLMHPADVITEVGGVNKFLDPQKYGRGIKTGFLKFDQMTGGLREGEMITLAARPGHGKTASALGIASNVAEKEGKAVAFFSLEMSKESLLQRLVCSRARVCLQKMRASMLNPEERRRAQQALFEISELPIYIDDTAGTNLMDVHSKTRRLQTEVDLGLVVIDYLQLMQGRGRFENRVQEISSLSRGCKLMSKELRVPVLALSQLSRAPETRAGDHRPMLSDLRDGGSIEQDSDIVAFVYRESLYKPEKESLRGVAELIIGKQRQGATGTCKLAFLDAYASFENLASDFDSRDEESSPWS